MGPVPQVPDRGGDSRSTFDSRSTHSAICDARHSGAVITPMAGAGRSFGVGCVSTSAPEAWRHSATRAEGRTAPHVVGIGELLWDILPAGERLGGAPFNVVAHLRRFGWSARFISAVGADEYGRRALAEVDRLGIDSSSIAINDLPTGVVRVVLDEVGAPRYAIQSPAAYESIPAWADYGRHAPDLLVFGSLAQCFAEVRAATRRLANIAANALRLFDVNLRLDRWTVALVADLLDLATVVKLNEDEWRTLSAPLDLPVHSVESFARALADRHALRAVCVTRGAMGAGLLLGGRYVEAPAPLVRVVDTVGAGDAFAAALAHGVFQGWPASETLAVANRLGSLVASRAGASPNWRPDELGIA